SSYFMTKVGRYVIKDMRGEMFEKFLRLPISYYDRSSSGEMLAKIIYNVEQVAGAATTVLTTLVRDSIKVLGLLGYMIYLNWKLSLLFLVVAPIIALIVTYITRRFRNLSRRIQSSMGDVTHVSEEMIDGNRVIKIFGGQDYERKRFDRVNEQNRLLHMKMVATDSAASPIIQFILAIVIAFVVYYITSQSDALGVTIGTFISFLAALAMMLTPIKSLTNINSALQKGIAAGESIFELFDTEEERDQGKQRIERARGAIQYRDVSYAYDEAKGDVLSNVNLEISPGETVAFVGRSGSGKTTLVNLLTRFYDIERGEVLLDGANLQSYALDSLRNQFAYVGQDVTLFNDTIANNIAYARAGSADIEEIREAARAAHALDFIEALPDGFETMVGENGVLLSGGQRQRLAIARALMKDAPILILDEATSALDTEAERHIQAALETLMQNRTTLVIAHRLSTVENADNIVVMQEGRIIEQGTHADLIGKGGQYARLHQMQFSESAV
ncbi:MAG: lipid A export permease/ATP-binding protein MsbA, partial [Gammaproteobacteria bacterium]|nr:lipid A export permease/ATP-binding protein MsbA [Gammaproteobacteria bacterium]